MTLKQSILKVPQKQVIFFNLVGDLLFFQLKNFLVSQMVCMKHQTQIHNAVIFMV